MSAEEDVLFIAIGCTVGGVFLIAVIVACWCFLCRNSAKKDGRHVKNQLHGVPSMHKAYSTNPQGAMRNWGNVDLGPNRAYIYNDKNPLKHTMNGGYQLRPASSESQLYGGAGSGFQRSVRRLQHFLQRNGPAFYQVDLEARQHKTDHELREDSNGVTSASAKKRANIPEFSDETKDVMNSTATGKMEFESEDRDNGLTSTSKTKLFAISKGGPFVANAYSSNGNINRSFNHSSEGHRLIHTSHNNSISTDVPARTPQPAVHVSRNPSRVEESGRYFVRPSYQHYDWRRSPYSSHQQIYVSNPNVYFNENPLMVNQMPWGFSPHPGGNIVLSPAATFAQPNSARVKNVSERPNVQRSSSHSDARNNGQMNGGLDAERMKPHKTNTSEKKDKKKKKKQTSDKTKQQAEIVPITSIDIQHKEIDGDIYAISRKDFKKKTEIKSSVENSKPETTIKNVKTNGNVATNSSYTRIQTVADVQQDGNIYDDVGIYESFTDTPGQMEPAVPSPGKDSDTGFDPIDGKHVTAAAFKFLESYDDEHYATAERKTSNELVAKRSQMSHF